MPNRFYRDTIYEEWSSQQDKNSFEFRAIDTCHKTHPEYDLEEIKNFIYMGIIENETNQKRFLENFGERHVNSDKLNNQLSKLTRIIFTQNSEFKSVDKRGHGDTISVKLGGSVGERGGRGNGAENVSFRVEEKAIRQAHYLIEHNLTSNQTISDMVRTGFVKYMEMIPIINEIRDGITDTFTIDMENERVNLEKRRIIALLEGYASSVTSKEEDLMEALHHTDNREELEELRDWVVNHIKNALSYSGPTKAEKNKIRNFIMTDSKLYNILTTLEREKLLTREYIDNIRQKGIAIPIVNLISDKE